MIKRMRHVLILVMVLNLLLISIPFSPVSAEAGVPFTLQAPANVTAGSTFDVYIHIGTVVDLATWQFDIVYDDGVVQIPGNTSGSSITAGVVGGKKAPVNSWGPEGQEDGIPVTGNTVTVVGSVKNLDGLNGDGYLCKVTYSVDGEPGDQCQIAVDRASVRMGSTSGKQDIAVGTVTNAMITVVAVDVTKPAKPAGLVGLAGDQQVLLTWTANTEDDLQYYKVYKSTNGGSFDDGVDVGKLTNYIVTGLENDTPYAFHVTAIDSSNNESDPSDDVSATPAAGSGVPVSIGAPDQVDMNNSFEVYINIGAVENLASWGFDLSYTSDVAQIPGNQNGNGVTEGYLGEKAVPVAGWCSVPGGSWAGIPVSGNAIRVAGLYYLPDFVTGNGETPSYLAVVHMQVIGESGETCTLHLGNVLLVNTAGEEIAALTNGDVIVTVTPDTTSPQVKAINPENGAEGVPTNTVMTAIFSEDMNGTTIDENSFTLSRDTTAVNGDVDYNATTRTATFTPGTLMLTGTVYTATLNTGTIKDPAGNPLIGNNDQGNYSWSFTTGSGPDNTAPNIIAINPEDGAINVPTNTHITAVFSEAMNISTINTDTFVIKRGIEVDACWVYYDQAKRTATLVPSVDMQVETLYTIEMSGTVTDIAGNTLSGGDYIWSFTTGDGPDLVRPEVTLVNPANKAAGVGTNTSVSAGFSEAMNASSITTATFTLKTTLGGDIVAGSVNYSGTTATFDPAANLAADTQYTATLSSYISDIRGNKLVGNDASQDYIWTFTTGAGEDTIPPEVSAIYTVDSPEGAATNTSIAAVFTEPMNPATINTSTIMLTQDSTPMAGTVTYAGVTGTFTPNSELQDNTEYTIIISTDVTDMAGNHMLNQYSLTFKTSDLEDLTPPRVSSTNPASGETGVAINQSVTVTFTKPMLANTVNTTTFTLVKTSNQTQITGTVNSSGSNGVFMPDAVLEQETQYTATISTGVKSLADIAMEQAYSWSFTTGSNEDTTAPEVSSTNPNDGDTSVSRNSAVTATFTEEMDPFTIITTNFTLVKTSDQTAVNGMVVYSDTTATFFFFSTSGPLAVDTQYTGTIKKDVKDLAGNPMLADYTWSFTTGSEQDITPPEISSTSPEADEKGVAVDRAVTATFNEAMYDLTITTDNFKLVKTSNQTAIEGAVNYYGATAIFTPLANLAFLTEYTATITTNVTDLAGNALASAYSWSFTTSDVPDTTLPTVSFTDPYIDETGVDIDQAISATFSEPMKEATITTATFTLATTSGNVDVEGTVHYVGTTALFTPRENLAGDTQFTARISKDVTDLAGNKMTNDYSWSFTTGTTPDTIAPTVSYTYPANGDTNIARSTAVTATFSEAMDATTISKKSFTLVKTEGGELVPGAVTYCITTATYTIIADMLAQTEYTATITTDVKDLAGNPLAENYTWTFKTGGDVDTTPPTVTTTYPLPGATNVPLNTAVSVTFSEEMRIESVNNTSFTLWKGTTSVAGKVSAVGATAIFTPDADMIANSTYTAMISTAVRDLSGNAMAAEYSWTFTTGTGMDTTRPEVLSTNPNDGDTGVATNRLIIATFSEAMNIMTISNSTYTLEVTADHTPVGAEVTYYDKVATLDPYLDLLPLTQYTAKISTVAADLAGNTLAEARVWSFTTGAGPDITPPEITSIYPADGATGIAITKEITVTFDEAIQNSTVNSGSFQLWKGSASTGTKVAGTVTYSANTFTATFKPTASMSKNTNYTAVVTTEIADLANNNLAVKKTWSFTTVKSSSGSSGGGGGGAIIVAPLVTSVTPAVNATGVEVSSAVSAVFSKEMNATTVTNSTFTLMAGTAAVTGTVKYDAASKTATLTPAAALAYSTVYTATITSGVRDTAGYALSANYTWSFTTMAAPLVKLELSGLSSSMPLIVDSKGILQDAASLKTQDGKVDLDIAKGASLLTTEKKPLSNLTAAFVTAAKAKAAPEGNALIMSYEFGPAGASFNPSVTMTMNYGTSFMPSGLTENSLAIWTWDGTQWQMLTSSKVDTQKKSVSANMAHFSVYALIGKVAPAVTTPPPPPPTTSAPVQPPPPPVATTVAPPPSSAPVVTTVAPTPTTEPGGLGGGAIAGIVIGALAVIAIVVILIRRRTRKSH